MPDPTPLEMIYDKMKSIDEKLDKVITCQIDLKVQDEIIKAKVSAIELSHLKLQSDLDQHKADVKTHYNPYYDETLRQKLWRKKPEIAAGGGLGAVIVAFVTWLIQNWPHG